MYLFSSASAAQTCPTPVRTPGIASHLAPSVRRAIRGLSPVFAGVGAYAVTAGVRQAAGASAGDRWTRTNHRGEPISLLEGPAVAAGLMAGVVQGHPLTGARVSAAALLATGGAAAAGLLDDLTEDTSTRTKGLRGHLGALREGRITTGALKILGIGASAFSAALVGTARLHATRHHATGYAVAAGFRSHGGQEGARRCGTTAYLGDLVVNAALIAGSANLVNLLDLRPGRALKASAAITVPLLGTRVGALSGAALGAMAAAAPGDLGERDMLGDCGANALGAMLGTQVAFALPRPARVLALAGVVGLTLASEKVSFSQVIDRNTVLRRIDRWGRRPAPKPTDEALGLASWVDGSQPAAPDDPEPDAGAAG